MSWKAYCDDYDRGTMFISPTGDPDDILVGGLAAEDAEAIVDAHNETEKRASKAYRFIGQITPDQWATIDKAGEAAKFAGAAK